MNYQTVNNRVVSDTGLAGYTVKKEILFKYKKFLFFANNFSYFLSLNSLLCFKNFPNFLDKKEIVVKAHNIYNFLNTATG